MSAVGITENAKGDNKKFEIWYNSREEVYIVQVTLTPCWGFFCLLQFSVSLLWLNKHVDLYFQVTAVCIEQ